MSYLHNYPNYDVTPLAKEWLLDWDFPNNSSRVFTHCMHSYPATFLPQLARKLILAFSTKGDTVCDIFCGSGTTLVESLLLGRNAVGIDLNPLAIMIAKAKTTPIPIRELVNAWQGIEADYHALSNKVLEPPAIDNIEFWFPKSSIEELTRLHAAISKIKNAHVRQFYTVALSQIMRLCSYAKNRRPSLSRSREKLDTDFSPDVYTAFKNRVFDNMASQATFTAFRDRNAKCQIYREDARRIPSISNESVDLIVTSPPYGDSATTVGYGRFGKLSIEWLGLERSANDVDNSLLGGITSDSDEKIGANLLQQCSTLRWMYDELSSRSPKSAQKTLHFFTGLYQSYMEGKRILKPNKFMCIVIGNRVVNGMRLKTDQITVEMLEQLGMRVYGVFNKRILNKRLPDSYINATDGKRHETMTKESIIVCRKE